MKKALLVLTIAISSLYLDSCIESGADKLIDLTPTDTTMDKGFTNWIAADTSFALQTKVILMEDFTGNHCPNCPDAALIIKDQKEKHPNRIVSMAVHAGAENLVKPTPNESKYDLTCDDATKLFELFGGGNLPIGSVDQVLYDGEENVNFQRTKWVSAIDQRLVLETPVNIEIEIIKIDADELKFKVKFVFSEAINDLYYSIYITEDSIVDFQLNALDHIEDYEHEHVLRKSVANYNGDAITPNPVKNSVYVKYFTQKIKHDTPGEVYKTGWDYRHLNVVVAVHRKSIIDKNYEVLHVAEKHVME